MSLSAFTLVYASPKIGGLGIDPRENSLYADHLTPRRGWETNPLRTIYVVTMHDSITASEHAIDFGEETQWFALQVDSKKASMTTAHLQHKGFETFTPTYAITRQWCDRKRSAELPLFPGYMFARLDYRNRLPVLVTPGVYGIVSCGKQPAPIPETEINSLKEVTRSGLRFGPWPFLTKGEQVTIARGVLAGLTGIVVEVKKSLRVVLCVDLIQRAVAVEVDADVLTSVKPKAVLHS